MHKNTNPSRSTTLKLSSLGLKVCLAVSLLGGGCAAPNMGFGKAPGAHPGPGTGMTPSRNLVADAAASDFHIYVRTPADGGNDAAAGTQGAPFATLHRAATFVRQNPGQTAVYVAAGEYSNHSTLNRLRFFLTDLNNDHTVILLGGYNPTDWAGRDSNVYVTAIRDTSVSSTGGSAIEFADNINVGLDGFTISGGSGTYPIGVFISGFGNVTLNNNRIYGSQTGPNGLGLMVDAQPGYPGSATIENNTVIGSSLTNAALGDIAQAIVNHTRPTVLIKGNVIIGRDGGITDSQDTGLVTYGGRIEANRIIGTTGSSLESKAVRIFNGDPVQMINNLLWAGDANLSYGIEIYNSNDQIQLYHNNIITGNAAQSVGIYADSNPPALRMLNNSIASLADSGQTSVGLEIAGYSNVDLIANNAFDPGLDHVAVGTNLCPGFVDDPDADSSTCNIEQFNDLPGFESIVNDNISYAMVYEDADGADDNPATFLDNDLSLPDGAPCTITGGGYDLAGIVDDDFAGNARAFPTEIGAYSYTSAQSCKTELELLPPDVAEITFPSPAGNTFVDTIIPTATIDIKFNKPMNEATLSYGPDLTAESYVAFYLGSTTTLVPDPAWNAGSFELVINGEDIFGQAMPEYRADIHIIDGVIYVRKGGHNDNPGTAELPKVNIQGALTEARELGLDLSSNFYLTELDIHVGAGNYKNNAENGSGILLMPGISIYGGYHPADWSVRDPDVHVTRVRDISEFVTGRIAATFELEPEGSRHTPVINGLLIEGGDSPSVAAVLAEESGLTINDCIIYGTKKSPTQRAVGVQMGLEGGSNRYTLDLANSIVIGSLNNPVDETIGIWALSDENTNIRKSIIKGSDAGSNNLAVGVQMAGGVLHRNRVQGDSQGGDDVKGLFLTGAVSDRPWVANNIIYSGHGTGTVFGIEVAGGGNGADLFNNHVFADSPSASGPVGIRIHNQPDGTVQLVNNAVSSNTSGGAKGIRFNHPADFVKFRNNVVKSAVPKRYFSTDACGGTCSRDQLDALGFIKLWADNFYAQDADGPDNNLQTIEDNNHKFINGASCKMADWGLNESSVQVDFYYESRTIYSVGAIEYISATPCTL